MIIWNRDFHGMDSVSATTRDYTVLTRGLSIKIVGMKHDRPMGKERKLNLNGAGVKLGPEQG